MVHYIHFINFYNILTLPNIKNLSETLDLFPEDKSSNIRFCHLIAFLLRCKCYQGRKTYFCKCPATTILISFHRNRNTTMVTNAHRCFRNACDNVTLVHKLVFLCKKTTYFANNENTLGQLFRCHCFVLFAIIHAKRLNNF